MNVAAAKGLLMVVAMFDFWPKKKQQKILHYLLCVKVTLRYLPFYLG